MKTGITGITMGCGNVKVLRKTFESLSTICDEIVYGDMLLFDEDREILQSYRHIFNLKIIPVPFDYIFHNGFSSILNILAGWAFNSTILYLNTSEIIEKDNGILNIVCPDYNCYYFDHATDPHRWFRFYNRHELKWSGRIHESLVPIGYSDFRPYHKAAFRMADLEKDMDNSFKAQVFNDVKEIVYFKNYMSIVDDIDNLGGTDPGWVKFATENYNSMKERLLKKGDRYAAFERRDKNMYLKDIYSNNEFEKQRFESNIGIEYQGNPLFLGKKN